MIENKGLRDGGRVRREGEGTEVGRGIDGEKGRKGEAREIIRERRRETNERA